MSDSTKFAYMAHDRHADAVDGAVLVFAPNMRTAHRLAWPALRDLYSAERYIDVTLRRIQGGADYHRDDEREAAGEAYVVESPEACSACSLWHPYGLDEQGRCDGCVGGLPDE